MLSIESITTGVTPYIDLLDVGKSAGLMNEKNIVKSVAGLA